MGKQKHFQICCTLIHPLVRLIDTKISVSLSSCELLTRRFKAEAANLNILVPSTFWKKSYFWASMILQFYDLLECDFLTFND